MMERKMVFSLFFFLIVVFAAQEAVMQIEASEIICFTYKGPCRHNSGGDSVVCHLKCLLMNKIISGGFCENDKCICEVG
ncbi:unnamed protein product [Trifolium pratense]|uniref:Uncharacterized protein n=1 Tax=Trifolium pratense TaxID=57577 RepID=A0ACB0L7P3_TRIPR|nr:unnamed protein product [Trifolium pratense]